MGEGSNQGAQIIHHGSRVLGKSEAAWDVMVVCVTVAENRKEGCEPQLLGLTCRPFEKTVLTKQRHSGDLTKSNAR